MADNRRASRPRRSGSVTRPRDLALSLIGEVVFDGLNLDQAVAKHGQHFKRLSSLDQSLVKALCYGCLRDWLSLQGLIQHYLHKPIRNKDKALKVVIALGLYQLLSMRVPDHAALDQTVASLDGIGKGWAKAMVNAVLRAAQRDRDQHRLPAPSSPESQWKHPAWLLSRIQQDWPQQAEQIFEANNTQAAMDLRCNRRHWSTQQALQALQDAGIAAAPVLGAEHAIRLQKPLEVGDIPAFEQGGFSVQDAAAQLAAPLLMLQDGQRVLDACAAPGGKSAHLLELHDIALHAIDIEAARVALIEDNFKRLRLPPSGESQSDARIELRDAADASSWWDKTPYQRILLDAPCSASGVIRRHPEIKLLRQADDIDRLASQQQRILQQLWPLLQSGGMLLYVTCSVFRQENDDVIAAFLEEQADSAILQTLELPWGRATAFGWQILPGDNQSDGFYYACLRKRDTAM